MRKRILSILVILSLLITVPVSFYATEQEASREFVVVSALGIFGDGADFSTELTRASILDVCLNLSCFDISNAVAAEYYADVPLTSPHNLKVSAATQLGIISGTTNGYYHPDEAAVVNDAVKMLVCVMGLGEKAEALGGYPFGYSRTARELKMQIPENDKLTYDDLAKMVYSILEAKTEVVTGLEINGNTYYEEGETLLERLDIRLLDGIFSANNMADIYGRNTTGRNVIRIAGEEVNTAVNYDKLLGSRVKAYAKEDNEHLELIYIDDYDNRITSVRHLDLINSSNILSSLEVKADKDGKTMTYRLEENPIVLYNGTVSDVYEDALFDISTGSLTLVDNDDDNRYEVVAVSEAVDIICDSYSKITEMIVDKTGQSADISRENTLDGFAVYNMAGEEILPESILEWDVGSVYYNKPRTYSDKKVAKVIISTNSVLGTVTSVLQDKIVIDGNTYYVSEYYRAGGAVNRISVGTSGTFYLNGENEICASKSDLVGELNKKVGVLVKVAENYNGLTNKPIFKIYTYNDEFIIADAAKRIEIDGERYDAEEVLSKAFGGTVERQVIRYMLNDDEEIMYIDTSHKGENENDDTLKKVYSVGDEKLKYREGVNSFANYYNVDSGTKTFSFPTDIGDDDGYQANLSFENDKSYNIDVYITDNKFSPYVIAGVEIGASNIKESQMFLVEEVSLGMDAETEEINYIIKALGQSNNTEYFMTEELYEKHLIEKGDIVCFAVKRDTEITEALKIYDLSEDKFFSDVNPYGVFSSNHRVVMGYVYEKNKNWFSLSFTDPSLVKESDVLENRNLDKYRKYVYDTEFEEARIADATDLVDYVNGGASASKVFVSDAAAWPKMCIIYN